MSRDVQGPWEPVYVGRVLPTALYRNHRGEQAHAVSLTHTAHADGSLSPLEWVSVRSVSKVCHIPCSCVDTRVSLGMHFHRKVSDQHWSTVIPGNVQAIGQAPLPPPTSPLQPSIPVGNMTQMWILV